MASFGGGFGGTPSSSSGGFSFGASTTPAATSTAPAFGASTGAINCTAKYNV